MNLQLLSFVDSWNGFWQDMYDVFIKSDRWKLYLEGLGNTLLIALVACLIGIVLGTVVAVLRVACINNKNNPLASKFPALYIRLSVVLRESTYLSFVARPHWCSC